MTDLVKISDRISVYTSICLPLFGSGVSIYVHEGNWQTVWQYAPLSTVSIYQRIVINWLLCRNNQTRVIYNSGMKNPGSENNQVLHDHEPRELDIDSRSRKGSRWNYLRIGDCCGLEYGWVASHVSVSACNLGLSATRICTRYMSMEWRYRQCKDENADIFICNPSIHCRLLATDAIARIFIILVG